MLIASAEFNMSSFCKALRRVVLKAHFAHIGLSSIHEHVPWPTVPYRLCPEQVELLEGMPLPWHKGHSAADKKALLALQEYTAKLGALQAKGDDYDIAAAQIGVEVYSAMSAAVGQ